MSAQGAVRRVVMVAYPAVQILDVTGPLEVFARTARWLHDERHIREPAYTVEVVATHRGLVPASSGLRLFADRALADLRGPIDTLMVAGGFGAPAVAPLRDLQRFILDHPGSALSVPALARRVAMSPRHFSRVFARNVGTTPARFVERVRVETARRRLEESGAGVDVVADTCGFPSAEIMRRAFVRTVRVNPSQYRQRFRRT